MSLNMDSSGVNGNPRPVSVTDRDDLDIGDCDMRALSIADRSTRTHSNVLCSLHAAFTQPVPQMLDSTIVITGPSISSRSNGCPMQVQSHPRKTASLLHLCQLETIACHALMLLAMAYPILAIYKHMIIA